MKEVKEHTAKDFFPGNYLTKKKYPNEQVYCRLMDALMTLTARAEAVEAAEVTWATLQAGMQLWGRVHTVKENGITVQVRDVVRYSGVCLDIPYWL